MTTTVAHRFGRPALAVALLIAAGLALLILALRQPQAGFVREDGATCVHIPGERIEAVAWSPDGAWLGVTSSTSNDEGRIRVVQWEAQAVYDIPVVDYLATSGVAVGPGGQAVWFEHAAGPEGEPDASRLLTARPGGAASILAEVDTPAFHQPRWTPDGIIGLAFDPATNSVSVVRVRTLGLESHTETVYDDTRPIESLWASPDGEWVVVDPRESGQRPEFVLLHNGAATSVFPPGRLVGAPLLEPDRRWVVYEDHDVGALVALEIESPGTEPKVLVSKETIAADISESGRLAFVLSDWAREANAACVITPDWGAMNR